MTTAETDEAWIRWGERDPYFAVITDPRYRNASLTAEAKRQFFDTGRWHVGYVLDACRKHLRADFAPRRVLDFGCGVGRVSLPFSEKADEVVGVDVSPAMLAEAETNAQVMGRTNIRWVLSDDELSRVQGSFDLVHSCITFQHIDVERGRRLFKRLVGCISTGGAGALQITYAKSRHADSFGQPPQTTANAGGIRSLLKRMDLSADPEMQMNPYHLGELAFILQSAGIEQFHTRFTDHGGELGVFLFFSKPNVA